jgi:hypothetical protein
MNLGEGLALDGDRYGIIILVSSFRVRRGRRKEESGRSTWGQMYGLYGVGLSYLGFHIVNWSFI